MTDWATADDVLTWTGVTVTDDDVIRAQALIEIMAGTTTEASDQGLINSRNLRLLNRAVSYQAAWMSQHPDVFVNVDTTGWSQDGAAATNAHANAHIQAPWAKRCLDRLSWNLAPLRARLPRHHGYDDRGNQDSVAYDDNRNDWVPLR